MAIGRLALDSCSARRLAGMTIGVEGLRKSKWGRTARSVPILIPRLGGESRFPASHREGRTQRFEPRPLEALDCRSASNTAFIGSLSKLASIGIEIVDSRCLSQCRACLSAMHPVQRPNAARNIIYVFQLLSKMGQTGGLPQFQSLNT